MTPGLHRTLPLVIGLAVVAAVAVLLHYTGTADRAAATRAAAGERGEILKEVRALDKRMGDTAARLDQLQEQLGKLQDASGKLADSLAALEKALAEQKAQAREPGPAEPAPAAAEAGFVVLFRDDFEQGVAGWVVPPGIPTLTGTVSHAKGEGVAKTGTGALRLSYEYQEGKGSLAARVPDPATREARRVSLWVRCAEGTAQLFVGATETDLSTYGVFREIRAEDGWQDIVVDLRDLQLVPDGQDENGRLDFDQIMALSVGDVGGFGGQRGRNALLIDDFTAYRAARPGDPPPGDF